MALTEDAKAELREAIRIVREDRFEAFVRSRTTPAKVDPPVTDPPPTDPPINPPPPKDDPPNDPPVVKKKGGYWGDLLDDE